MSRPSAMALQVEILANPLSGRGHGPQRARRIAELLSARGHSVGIHDGRSGEDAAAWAARAAHIADRLVVVGGDGSLNAVLNGLPASPPPIVLSPLGTANLVAYGLGVDAKVERAAWLVEAGRTQHVDLARADYRDAASGARRSRLCLMCTGFGFDGELMRRFDASRDGPVHRGRYLKHLGDVLREWTPMPQTVVADGEELGEFVYGVFSGFGVYGLSQLKMGPSDLQDGLWELTLFPNVSLLRTGMAALAAAGGQLDKVRGVIQRRVRHVTVAAQQPTPLQVDGDYVGDTPLELRIGEAQVRFLVAP